MGKNVGLIGGVRGKVGNVVFSTRRGVQIARAYQPVVANPQTKRQTLSRAKLALATAIAKACSLFLRAGWQKYYPTYEVQRGIGLAIPVGNGVILGNDPASLAVSYSDLAEIFSAKDLPYPATSGLDFDNESEVDVVVSPQNEYFVDEDGNAIGAGAVVAVYVPEIGLSAIRSEAFADDSSNVAVAVRMPEIASGMEAHVYVFVKQIPEALNGIASATSPWKYPARTSWCAYAGHGTIA